MQFITWTVTYEYVDVNLNQMSGTLSGLTPCTGNGGDPMAADGSTVYVDSLTLGTLSYVGGGGSGKLSPWTATMSDIPMGNPGPTLRGLIDDIQNDNPSAYFITSVTSCMEFTTYLLLCDLPVWKWDWGICYTITFSPSENDLVLGPPVITNPVGSPTSSLAPDHLTAATNFAGGNSSGAPHIP